MLPLHRLGVGVRHTEASEVEVQKHLLGALELPEGELAERTELKVVGRANTPLIPANGRSEVELLVVLSHLQERTNSCQDAGDKAVAMPPLKDLLHMFLQQIGQTALRSGSLCGSRLSSCSNRAESFNTSSSVGGHSVAQYWLAKQSASKSQERLITLPVGNIIDAIDPPA